MTSPSEPSPPEPCPPEVPPPSDWVRRHAPRASGPGAAALDLACGSGRHARLLLALGFAVTAVDRDLARVADLAGRAELIAADLEDGAPWPLPGRRFALVVVTNYLWRPILPRIADGVAAGGWLVYETFAAGNARFGRPARPEHLLDPGELLAVATASGLVVHAYEHGEVATPRPAMIQRIAAHRPP